MLGNSFFEAVVQIEIMVDTDQGKVLFVRMPGQARLGTPGDLHHVAGRGIERVPLIRSENGGYPTALVILRLVLKLKEGGS